MPYALFKDGVQISKTHFIKPIVWIEALEKKVVFQCKYGQFLSSNYEIKETEGKLCEKKSNKL